IIDIINEIKNNKLTNYNVDGKTFEKEFKGECLKWGLEVDNESIRLTVIDYNYRRNRWNPDDKKKSLDILPSIYPNGQKFILHCEILENDDFVTITRIGVIIWTYKSSKIKMHYYWNNWNDRLNFKNVDIEFKNPFESWTPGRILPAS
ncbi:31340_t:CDS:1, partial [Racocetra persica]